MKKNILKFISVVSLLTLCLTGCGSTKSQNTGTEAAKGEKVKIEYWHCNAETQGGQTVEELVKKFNEEPLINVFLISLKAGGVGLNLTSASVVIHFDPWWNPAIENQATDRAHRFGQKNVVEVVKLISKDTIEEKILLLQEDKKELIESLMDEKEMDGKKFKRLSEDEILNLDRKSVV